MLGNMMKKTILTILLVLNTKVSFSSQSSTANSGFLPETINAEKTIFITQKEFSVVAAEDEKHIIASIGEVAHGAIGIYDPITKKASLAHCDAFTSPSKSMPVFLHQACACDTRHVKIFLYSQYASYISSFQKELKSLGVRDGAFTIIRESINSSVAIDATDGTFFTYKFDWSFIKGKEYTERFSNLAWRIYKVDLVFIKRKPDANPE